MIKFLCASILSVMAPWRKMRKRHFLALKLASIMVEGFISPAAGEMASMQVRTCRELMFCMRPGSRSTARRTAGLPEILALLDTMASPLWRAREEASGDELTRMASLPSPLSSAGCRDLAAGRINVRGPGQKAARSSAGALDKSQ